LHGIIWVESEYHKGSKFMFAVPLEQAKNSKADN
jgi:signal transduction histidine kinase